METTALLAAAVTAVIARYVDAVEPLMVVACAAGCMCVVEAVGRLWRAAPRDDRGHRRGEQRGSLEFDARADRIEVSSG